MWMIFSNFFRPPLSQPHPNTAAVLVDEFDARAYESPTNCFDRLG
jgi:hypothetical protein